MKNYCCTNSLGMPIPCNCKRTKKMDRPDFEKHLMIKDNPIYMDEWRMPINNTEMLELANQAFDEWLEKQQTVFGMKDEFGLTSFSESLDTGNNHMAKLVCIEEL